MKIVLTGGTGFIGKSLTRELLNAGHQVVLLSRRAPVEKAAPGLGVLLWDGVHAGPWTESVDGADAVINLAGEPIAAKRWTPSQKKAIVESRLSATRAIVDAICKASRKPSILINASAVGFYGNVPEGEVTESRSCGTGFLAETCSAWEQEALRVEPAGVRVVLLRIGIVLEKGGGALEKMIPPFFMFAGGPLGSGRQWFPWVHREDIVGMILFALNHPDLSGPVNAVAPAPVTMKDFSSALGRAMGRPSWAPVPGFVLKLLLGEMSEMLIGGQKVVPQVLQRAGYPFRYPELNAALAAVLKK